MSDDDLATISIISMRRMFLRSVSVSMLYPYYALNRLSVQRVTVCPAGREPHHPFRQSELNAVTDAGCGLGDFLFTHARRAQSTST
jgi:hypothetical protein